VNRRRRHPPLPAFAVMAMLLLSAFALSSCAEPTATTLPRGVTVDVYQGRFDYADHALEVAVANATTLPFTVLALSFSSPTFTPPVNYERAPTTIQPGDTVNLRLLLPPADCSASSGEPRVHVRYVFGEAAGSATKDTPATAVADLTPRDRMGQLPTIAAEDCRDDAVAAVATIEPATALRYVTLAGQQTAVLDFTATPTGAGGLLMIDDVRGTVLVGALDPANGKVGDTVPLGLDIGRATSPVTFSLTLVPARCDPHVVVEDKRGTFFTFTVTTKLDTGRIFIGVNDAVRVELYDYVGRRCGWS